MELNYLKWEHKIIFPHPHHETISWSRSNFIETKVKKSLKIKRNPWNKIIWSEKQKFFSPTPTMRQSHGLVVKKF